MVAGALVAVLAATSCRGPKLSVANEQMARGEYFDASKTYRKIYNKLTKREERPQRGEVAFKMAECHRHLNQFARAAAAYQNAARYGYPDSTLYLYMGQMLAADGKYAPAVTALKDYLQWKPGDELARNALAGAEYALGKKGRRAMLFAMPSFSTPAVPTMPRCISTAVSTSFISLLPLKR